MVVVDPSCGIPRPSSGLNTREAGGGKGVAKEEKGQEWWVEVNLG